MNIKEINIPKGIRYLSDWEEFRIPNHPCIIDKQIPGCGFTEYCLTNNQNIILACPRRILLENKRDQHIDDVHLVKNYYQELAVDQEINTPSNKIKKDKFKSFIKAETEGRDLANKNRGIIEKDLDSYISLRWANNKPAKILVTYDSYRIIMEFLKSRRILNKFHTVVDEFQSIFIDSRFKADTELEFVDSLQGINNLCYVSATPMLENYLDQIEDFKDLPYYRFNWNALDPGRVAKPVLSIRSMKFASGVVKDIIDHYHSGNYKKSARINDKGESEIVESKEAVIYINSVNGIISAIKKNNLRPEEVNILCANTSENQKRITRELGNNFEIGRVPLKNEPRKMFTFCTRTIYLGADMYSDNARTFVISDANIDSMAVDISLDLPQILGRQRLESNPWKNKATVYIKTSLIKNRISLEEFKKMIANKLEETNNLLRSYNGNDNDVEAKSAFARIIQREAINYNYQFHYLGVNCHKNSYMVPEINVLALVSEQRAYDIQQIDYADRFSVFNKVNSTFKDGQDSIDNEIQKFQELFNNEEIFERKLMILCTTKLSSSALSIVLDLIPEYFKLFYISLGPDRCRELNYKYSKLKAELENKRIDKDLLLSTIYSEFKVGDTVSKIEIKERLKSIYELVGLNKTAKATDLEQLFELRTTKVVQEGKAVSAFKILKIKE